jgi:hypothetical protein
MNESTLDTPYVLAYYSGIRVGRVASFSRRSIGGETRHMGTIDLKAYEYRGASMASVHDWVNI